MVAWLGNHYMWYAPRPVGGYDDPSGDLNDPLLLPGNKEEQLRQRRLIDARLTEQFINDLQTQMESGPGRRVTYTLLSWLRPLEDCSNREDEGRAQPGRRLLKTLLRHCPEQYLRMMTEADEHNKRTSASIREDPSG